MTTRWPNLAAAAVCAVTFPCGLWAGDWPQWRCDAAHSANAPDKLPEGLRLLWSRQLPTPRPAWPASQPSLRFDVSYSPVAAGGLLFVPSMVEDSVTAYDADTGSERWRFFTDGPVRFAPVFDDGRLYAGSDDGFLYCLDAATGALLWRCRGGPADRNVLGNERLISTWPVRGAPVLKDGVAYFTAGIWPFMGIFVHAVDAATGKCVWTNSGDSITYQTNPHNSPAFGGLVPRGYLAVTDRGLLAPGGRTPPGLYDLKTGRLQEFLFTAKGGRSNPVPVAITAGGVQFRPGRGEVTSDGFRAEVDGDVWELLAAADRLFAVTTTGRIYCYGSRQGEPKSYDLPLGDCPDFRGECRENGTVPLCPFPALDEAARRTAAGVLKMAGADAGYALVLGIGSGDLAEAIIRGSRLQIIAIDADAAKIDAFRRRMVAAGLYGTRVAAHVGEPAAYPWPPYLASLIVAEDLPDAWAGDPAWIRNVFKALRPYGGTACLRADKGRLAATVERAGLENAVLKAGDAGWTLLVREGDLPGAADWTHQYADAGNSVVSRDRRVKTPLGLLWFGGPSNDEVLPRHGHGPSPQVAAGRLVIEGPDMLRALDIYTGRPLWQRRLPGLGAFYDRTTHQPGAGEIGSNYVTLPDAVYVIHGDAILQLDPANGETTREIKLQPTKENAKPNWGSIAVWKDWLIATTEPATVAGTLRVPSAGAETGTADGTRRVPATLQTVNGSEKLDLEKLFVPARYASASRRLVVLDRTSGKELWRRDAIYGFRHNNIAIGGGKVFAIDGLSQAKCDALRRRGLAEKDYRPRLLALDLRTGDVAWSTGENVFGTFLNYSAEHDVLLQAGSRARDRADDEAGQGMVAYRGKDGAVIWKDLNRAHAGPCMLHGDTIITQGPAYSLLTGKPKRRKHPVTGTEIEWKFTRNYGCNTAIAGQNLITFRSAAAGFYDLSGDGGTGNFGGFKSSCTSNLIVAGGLLNAPEYTRTCVCNYQNQTSLAMVHDPDVELWTFNAFAWDGAPVTRIGINFGAPGDRRVGDGTLWLDFPSQGGPSPDIPVEVKGQPRYFRRHGSTVATDAEAEYGWVAASGVEGVSEVTLTLAKDPKPRRYTVRLQFAEPRQDAGPGDRVFDVSLQGREVLAGLDIVREAGGVNRAIVKQFSAVEVRGTLTISLAAKSGSPILSGIEVVAEQAAINGRQEDEGQEDGDK